MNAVRCLPEYYGPRLFLASCISFKRTTLHFCSPSLKDAKKVYVSLITLMSSRSRRSKSFNAASRLWYSRRCMFLCVPRHSQNGR